MSGQDENGGQGNGAPAWMREELRDNSRLGKVPGANPDGAKEVSYEQLPDDPESLKAMYIELQRTLKDNYMQSYVEKERLRWGTEETVEDLLSKFWKRGLELITIAGFVAIVISVFAPSSMSQFQRTVGLLVVTAFWERYLRYPVNRIGKKLAKRYNI